MRNIFAHAISTGTVLSLKITCTIRTTSSHLLSTSSFSCLAYLRHPFKYSSLMPDGTPALPNLIPYIAR